MDGLQAAGSPAASPVKGRGIRSKKPTTGKGVTKRKGKKGGNTKGRGRNKIFEDPRVQAAYDRQKVLRDLYSEVASAIKPALDDLASRSLNTLMENPTAHEETPEFAVIQKKLDNHLEEVINHAEREFNLRTAVVTREYQHQTAISEKKVSDGIINATEDFYDATLRRLIHIEQLHQDLDDVNTPDKSYKYIEKPDSVVREQGNWVVYRDGVEVPYPSRLEENKKTTMAKGQNNKGKAAAKRKAEDQLDIQPDTKKSAALSGSAKPDNGDESVTPQPRHIKGLLAAEAELDGEPESNAPSPAESGPKPAAPRGRKTASALPDGASEPDQWGVRVVARRGQKANNRLILPCAPSGNEEDDDDDNEDKIGVQDPANKKVTKTPSKFHVDRTIVTYDCLAYEEDALDSELVEKYKLHPKYGLALPCSRNDSEPPALPVSGLNPVVVTTPNGATLHASRSVKKRKMDTFLRDAAVKDNLSFLINRYCDEKDIAPEDITTEEMRERKRLRLYVEQPLAGSESDVENDGNGNGVGESESEGNDGTGEGEDEHSADQENNPQPTEVGESVAKENLSRLLKAAFQADADQPNYPTSNLRSSRPYDAVRDVFTNMEPTPPLLVPADVDTTNMSVLADVAEQVYLQRDAQFDPGLDHRFGSQAEYRQDFQLGHHANGQFEYTPDYIPDRRPSIHLGHPFDQPEMASMDPLLLDPRLRGPLDPVPPPPNTFLQTALNPPPTLTHIAPAPPLGSEPPAQVSLGRNPFTGQGTGKGSPVLPPLRPSRREKAMDPNHHSQPTLVQQAPDYASSLSMIQSNSGNYFPPAPHRPYHQPYTLPEQGPMMAMPFMTSGGGMVLSQPSHHQVPSRRLSYQPPSPKMQSHTQLGVMPMHMPHGSPASPPGSSMGLRSPTGPPGSRHRASISSGSTSAGNNKYRRIAAAPIPHNRPWQGNGGNELRLAHYDHRESIKDYPANEPPPRTGPTTIRGWNVNNVSKGRKGLKKEDSEEKESPSITTFIGKWNPSERT